jgi:hypothetical protein
MDDEIAVGQLLLATARWATDNGPAPYPLSRACQDHLLGLAIEESAATHAEVWTGTEAWAQ